MTATTNLPKMDANESINKIRDIYWMIADADTDLESILPGGMWQDAELTITDRQKGILKNALKQLDGILESFNREWQGL